MFSFGQKFFVVPQKSPPLMGWIGEIICEENGNCVIAILRNESARLAGNRSVIHLSTNDIARFNTPKEAMRYLRQNRITIKGKD